MRYYISDKTQSAGFREVTETEFNEHTQFRREVNAYAERVANNEIDISEVPETHRSAVEQKLELNEATINDYQDALGEFGVKV